MGVAKYTQKPIKPKQISELHKAHAAYDSKEVCQFLCRSDHRWRYNCEKTLQTMFLMGLDENIYNFGCG